MCPETDDPANEAKTEFILAELNLTADATDDEIAAAARHLDPEAPEDAEGAIRTLIVDKKSVP